MVPEGWYTSSLAALCSKTISYGIVQTGVDGVGPIPCVRVVDLTKAKPVTSHMITTTEAISKSYKKTILEEDEIMLALRGEVGLVKMVDQTLVGCNLTRGLARVAAKKSEVLPEYLFRQIQSESFRRDLIRRISGSALQEIPLGELRKVEVTVAPLPEQRKIADILSTWDQAIEKTEALLTNARTQKRALMQQLLTGKRRFPEFEGQSWKEVRLGDVGTTVSGGTPSSGEESYWDGELLWATPTDITKLTSRFINDTARKITFEGLKKSSAKLLPEGALLICSRATIGDMAISTGPICTNQGFKSLVLAEGYDSDFMFYLLQFFKNELVRYACGSTFLELSKKDFEKRKFNVPSHAEQKAIASVLNDAEAEIDEHRESIAKLRTEKKALMQKLLTGKRRVTV